MREHSDGIPSVVKAPHHRLLIYSTSSPRNNDDTLSGTLRSKLMGESQIIITSIPRSNYSKTS